MPTYSKPFLFGFFLILALCGCGQSKSDYIQTIRSGLDLLPWPKQMEALFGDGDHFITHYGMGSGPKEWNSEVFFQGRYVLTLQVDVAINYWNNEVEKIVSSPKFYLVEVDSTVRENVGTGANSLNGWEFDEAKWKKLLQAKGDWSAIGINVRTNDPVVGFEDYVKGLRAPRIKIPHRTAN